MRLYHIPCIITLYFTHYYIYDYSFLEHFCLSWITFDLFLFVGAKLQFELRRHNMNILLFTSQYIWVSKICWYRDGENWNKALLNKKFSHENKNKFKSF